MAVPGPRLLALFCFVLSAARVTVLRVAVVFRRGGCCSEGESGASNPPPGTGSHTRGNLYQGVHAQSNDTSFVGRSLSLRTALKPIAGNSGACQHWELTAEVSHQTPPVALPTPQHPPRSRRTDNNHQDYGWQNCSRQAVTGTTDTHEDGHTTGGGTAGFFSKTKKCGSNPRHMDNDLHARLAGPRPV